MINIGKIYILVLAIIKLIKNKMAKTNGKNIWDKVEGADKASETRIRVTREESESVLSGLFDDSFEKKETRKVEKKPTAGWSPKVPYPFARFGKGFDETDINKYLNKYEMLKIDFDKIDLTNGSGKVGDSNSRWFSEVIDGNQTDPKLIERNREEFLYFTMLATLGYYKSMDNDCQAKESYTPPSLRRRVEETRALIKKLAFSATQKYNPQLVGEDNINDPRIVLANISYKAIDEISDLFAEKFGEPACSGEMSEKARFYLTMQHPNMQACVKQVEYLAGFEKSLNIAENVGSIATVLMDDLKKSNGNK